MLAAIAVWAQDAVNPDVFEKGMARPGVQLLDVRTAKEFKTGHLPNALQADFTKKDEFTHRLQSVDKSKPVYIYCLSGGRSAAAAKWMRENGYKEVIELTGGTMAWKKAGKPLTGANTGPQMTTAQFDRAVAGGKWVLVDVGAALFSGSIITPNCRACSGATCWPCPSRIFTAPSTSCNPR